MTEQINEILNQCSVEGFNVKLPAVQLDCDTYKQVADKLKKIGGKWTGGKTQAFVFPHNPAELLTKIQSGERVNLKKDFQAFYTPQILAQRLVALAEIEDFQDVLEPSAGLGAIVKEIPRNCFVFTYEINELLHEALKKLPNVAAIDGDFLQTDKSIKYERIVANPPFSKNQDIDHIRKMYSVLADNGVLVSIASKHWQTSTNKKETDFRLWLATVGATIFEVEAGAFKESGTNIPTVIIRITK